MNKLLLYLVFLICLGITLSQWDLQDYGQILSNEHRLKYYWGTYKPNLYFAVKNRRNVSTVLGMMWYGADKGEQYKQGNITDRIRHNCKMSDNLKYYYVAHNGEDYAYQVIDDKENNMKLSQKFVKRDYSGLYNQTWDVLIEGNVLNSSSNKNTDTTDSKPISLVLYTALENFSVKDKAHFKLTETKEGIELIQSELENGKATKKSIMKFDLTSTASSTTDDSNTKNSDNSNTNSHIIHRNTQKYRKKYEEVWRVKDFISEELQENELTTKKGEYATFVKVKKINTPNIIAIHLVVKPGFRVKIAYSAIGDNDLQTATANLDISNNHLDELLQKRLNEYNHRFDNLFKVNFTSLPNIVKKPADMHPLKTMMKQTVSNILGNIGYYWGKIDVHFDEKMPKGRYHQGFRFALDDKGLFTSSPCRSFFARGFLWDEGFHNIIISQWNYNTTVDIIDSWLSTMSATGYIAREQIRGKEQEAQVPKKFIQQNKLIANPPTFIFAVNNIINHYKFYNEERDLKHLYSFLKKCFDKFSSWYEWFEFYQKSSSDKESYQWQGRNTEQNLASGLDDFPRGLTSNIYEKHLDLYIWVMELSRSIRNLAEIFDYELVGHFDEKYEKMRNNLKKHFFDKTTGVLSDFLGPQYNLLDSKKFKRPVSPITWRGDNKCGASAPNPLGQPADCNPYSDSPCCSEFGWCGNSPDFCDCPKCRKAEKLEARQLKQSDMHNPHIGYVTLYPLMFGLLDETSEEFTNLLKYLADPEELFSPYGIRSLSKSDLLYHTGEDYWRGHIWMNLNFLTLRGLYIHYKDNAEAYSIYKEIRQNIINTVYKQWQKTGMFYEQYSDVTGEGLKAHPFNGWTALVNNIITENYDVDIL